MITIRTLGPVEVLIDGDPAPPELIWRKHLALLVYLARSPDNARTREHLVGLLWGEKPESAARHSLNEALRIIRRCCGDDAVETGGGRIRLSCPVSIDTDAFDVSAEAEDWSGAAGLVSGEFMEGFSVPGEWGFEEWLSVERSMWSRRSVEALVNHAEACLSAGDARTAAEAAAWASRLEPASEPACRTIMCARALSGDRSGALAAFERFAERLQEEVGIEPSDATAALAERIGAERGWETPEHLADRTQIGAESRRAPLVERDDELARLVGAWHACMSGEARVAIIEGEPGSGRTRLLQELIDRARLDGAVTAVLRAVEGDRQTRWSGLVGLLRSGLSSAEGAGNVPAAARAALARLLSAAGRGDGTGDDDSAGAAFSELVSAAATKPVLLAVDDAHWLDVESLLAIGAAVRDAESAPLLAVFTVPTYAVSPEIDELRARIGRDVPGESVQLRPLTGAALRKLADWALPEFTPVELDRVARRLASDTAGLPLLAVELLHALALGLDMDAGDDAWPAPLRTLDHTMPADLPDTITAAIRVGYRRLSRNAQSVLAAAAVLAARNEPDVLARATSLTEDDLFEALDELEWGRWLHAEPRGYAFVARIVREVIARDMVTAGQRRRILEVADAS